MTTFTSTYIERHNYNKHKHMENPAYRDINWLKSQYIDSKRTLKDIGEECGTSWGTIKYWCDKYNIPLRDPKDPENIKLMYEKSAEKRKLKINKEWIRERYEDRGMTLKEIADEYGCNWRSIQRRCNYFGIPLREPIIRRSVMNRKFIIKDEFSDIKSLKNAMVKIFGYDCMYPGCIYNKFIELHHVDGTNTNTNKEGKTVSHRKHTCNRISNSVLLCPNHHAEADAGLITKEQLKEIITSRELKIKSDTPSNGR